MKPFYRFCYLLAQSITRLFFRLSVKGRKNIPDKGAFIAASNHIAYADPVVIGSIMKREIGFMAKAELFKTKFMRKLLAKVNAFPIHRGKSDVASFKTSIRTLTSLKMPLLVFPEGTRILTGELGQPKRGIALLASQTKVPILPIYIENSDRLLQCALFRRRIKIRIGPLIEYSEYMDLATHSSKYNEFCRLIMARIQLLKDKII
jgi:1-acyl-sn-glycerol-3-phosphate acyltransferase